jgi:hypothetical protein
MVLFPLANRYQAAWGEHAMRIAQRQSVMQMYLTAVGVIFGFYFTHLNSVSAQTNVRDVVPMNEFLAMAVTFITVISSFLVLTHNRVMENLIRFMKNCERCASETITADGGHETGLFYFYDGEKVVAKFHHSHRMFVRFLFCFIFLVTNSSAIYLAWKIDPWIKILCIVMLIVASLFLFHDLYALRRRFRKSSSKEALCL